MSILSGKWHGWLSLSALADLDTALSKWVSVTSCKWVDDTWVCERSNPQQPDAGKEKEQEDASKTRDTLSLEERKLLSEFFLPIADALSEEKGAALIVPSQYNRLQVYKSVKKYDENDLGINNMLFDLGYYGYGEYQPVVMKLYPMLEKKWRKVPCDQLKQPANSDLYFMYEDEVEPLDEGKTCGIIASAIIIVSMLLLCFLIQKIKAKTHRHQPSEEKAQQVLIPTENGSVGNYVPPSLTIAATKNLEKTAGEPQIFFI